MQKKPRIVIIGAGPAGLGAGWRLTELGYADFVIYDKHPFVGGLATSFTDDAGFTWDIGGHVLHSHYPYFDRMFEDVMQGEYFTHQRESWVWIHNRFVPYPFQNNIHRLPPDALRDCLQGLQAISKRTPKTLRTFADWIDASFGSGIAKHFLLPYNRKVWAYPPERMSYQWVGDRVATVDVSRIERNIREQRDDVSWGPNAVFHYPKRGGTGNIWKRVAKRFASRIVLQKEVTGIDAAKKTIRFSDGSADTYDLLFTSMPLPVLARLVQGVPLSRARTEALHASAVTVVGLGVAGRTPDALKTKCWMYFPDSGIPFFRATVLSNYSPYNAPKGSWSFMAEISSSRFRPLPDGDIVDSVLRHAQGAGLIPKYSRITDRWTMTSDYGYPTPTLGRDAIVDPLLAKLETYDIYSRGRFGMWKYEVSNQDHTFMQGVEWVDKVMTVSKTH